jgi:hypothetical protein
MAELLALTDVTRRKNIATLWEMDGITYPGKSYNFISIWFVDYDNYQHCKAQTSNSNRHKLTTMN